MAAGLRTLVLCGGRGTRAWPATAELPKPLLPVGGQPVLRHVLEIYARQGFTDFVLAAGYQAAKIEEFAAALPPEWTVDVVDTGLEANTGERVFACRDRLSGRFLVTYGDGLGNVDLLALVHQHEVGCGQGGVATVTTVPLPSQYGTIDIDDTGRVREFREKPVLMDHWINAGFFAFEEAAFDRWEGTDLERQVLPRLARENALFVHRHRGFWKSLDTQKDMAELHQLATDGSVPWLHQPAA